MHQTQRQQTHALLQKRGIRRALFAHPDSVTWLTGLTPLIETGPGAFGGGPSLVWYDSGHFLLICTDAAMNSTPGIGADYDLTVTAVTGYTIEHPIDAPQRVVDVLREALVQSRGTGELAVEIESVSGSQLMAVQHALGQVEVVAADRWLVPLRMIKTDEELAAIRRAFALCDIGFEAAQQTVRAGLREIDIWTAVDSAIQQAAGRRVPLGNDCVVSTRNFNIGGPPGTLAIHPGDTVMIDLGPQHAGYWSDGCRVAYPAERTSEQLRRHRFISNALDFAISLVKPGVRARDIDEKTRAFIRDGGYPVYPHHTGHGIGVAAHEEPRIVPYNDVIIEPGMVILLEPGTYVPGESACRLEDGLLVTHDGVEILTRAPREPQVG